jgi:Trk-type K+ transport system membrane component
MRKNVWRAVIEVGFIVFLFYSNLLMGEFERSGMGQKKGIAWAINDVFTAANFGIAMIAGLIGYVLFEFLRKKF